MCVCLMLLQLLESMTSHMVEARSHLRRGSSSLFVDSSQLLLIVSDGRCLGDQRKVKAAVRHAQEAQIFLVFIVLDNPNKEVSSLMLRPVFLVDKVSVMFSSSVLMAESWHKGSNTLSSVVR